MQEKPKILSDIKAEEKTAGFKMSASEAAKLVVNMKPGNDILAFEQCKHDQLHSIIKNRTNTTFELARATMPFEEVTLGEKPIEVPPTPLVFMPREFAQIIFYTDDSARGRWTKFLLFVYANNGKIYYSLGSQDKTKAEIFWG